MISHMISQHKKKWEEYQKLTNSEKVSFFDRAVPYVSTLSTNFGNNEKKVYRIYTAINDDGICKYYVEGDQPMNDYDETSHSDSIFKLVDRTSNDDFILIIIDGGHFGMGFGNVAISMSFL